MLNNPCAKEFEYLITVHNQKNSIQQRHKEVDQPSGVQFAAESLHNTMSHPEFLTMIEPSYIEYATVSDLIRVINIITVIVTA